MYRILYDCSFFIEFCLMSDVAQDITLGTSLVNITNNIKCIHSLTRIHHREVMEISTFLIFQGVSLQ
jgi:hypothetical protein